VLVSGAKRERSCTLRVNGWTVLNGCNGWVTNRNTPPWLAAAGKRQVITVTRFFTYIDTCIRNIRTHSFPVPAIVRGTHPRQPTPHASQEKLDARVSQNSLCVYDGVTRGAPHSIGGASRRGLNRPEPFAVYSTVTYRALLALFRNFVRAGSSLPGDDNSRNFVIE
jgi:hypothetical protein